MNRQGNHEDLSAVVEAIKKTLTDIPGLVHSWRFLAGVVYALNQYYQMNVQCPSANIADECEYVSETDDVLSHILEKGHPNPNWVRGFYYNAAVMRLDACYERIFKAYLDLREQIKCSCCEKNLIDGPYLYERIKNEFGSLFSLTYEESNFGKVRHEVNSLKHFEGGADREERELPELLHRSLAELVSFLRDPKVNNKLIEKFSEKEIIVGRNKPK
jgi:hypothetical protein